MATLDQFLAESGRQSTLDEIRRQPGGYEKALSEYNSTGYLPSWGITSSSESARKSQQESEAIQRKAEAALQQGISTLEGGRSLIAPIYKSKQDILQGEMEPTKQRYEALLQEIARREMEDKNKATLYTSNEMGRRGVSGQSGLYERAMQQNLSPINQYYAGQAKDVGFQRESDLRAIQAAIAELANQQALQELGLTRDIGTLQASGGMNAAQLALQLLTNRQTEAQNQATNAYNNALLQLQQNQPTDLGLKSVDLGDRVMMFDSQGNVIASYSKGLAPKGTSSSGTGTGTGIDFNTEYNT